VFLSKDGMAFCEIVLWGEVFRAEFKAVYKMFVMMITFPNLSINDDSYAVSSQYKSDANIRSCTVLSVIQL
jgi:hypothetical protein